MSNGANRRFDYFVKPTLAVLCGKLRIVSLATAVTIVPCTGMHTLSDRVPLAQTASLKPPTKHADRSRRSAFFLRTFMDSGLFADSTN